MRFGLNYIKQFNPTYFEAFGFSEDDLSRSTFPCKKGASIAPL